MELYTPVKLYNKELTIQELSMIIDGFSDEKLDMFLDCFEVELEIKYNMDIDDIEALINNNIRNLN